MITHVTEGNIFDDLGFEPEEAENLKMRAELMSALREQIRKEELPEAMAAKRLGATVTQVRNLLSGRIDRSAAESGCWYGQLLDRV